VIRRRQSTGNVAAVVGNIGGKSWETGGRGVLFVVFPVYIAAALLEEEGRNTVPAGDCVVSVLVVVGINALATVLRMTVAVDVVGMIALGGVGMDILGAGVVAGVERRWVLSYIDVLVDVARGSAVFVVVCVPNNGSRRLRY
jgi:hypothetical protein